MQIWKEAASGTALLIAAIWVVNKQIEDIGISESPPASALLSLFVALCLSTLSFSLYNCDFQMNKNKFEVT